MHIQIVKRCQISAAVTALIWTGLFKSLFVSNDWAISLLVSLYDQTVIWQA